MTPAALIQKYLVKPTDTIREAAKIIDQSKDGIALVISHEEKLIGTVTDGDIRRYLLTGESLDDRCEKIMTKNPVSISEDASKSKVKAKLAEFRLRNIPIVDKAGRPKAIVDLRDLIDPEEETHTTIAVVMAGGEGQRLRPLTENLPKPMIKVGGKPILEHIIGNLRQSGIRKIFISVNYQAETIMDYFKDGRRFDVEIAYLKEPTKLGTAGALSLLPIVPGSSIVVMNGDVVTTVNIEKLMDFHRKHRAALSIAAAEYKLNIPYGVLNLAGHFVLSLAEKPTQRFLCNAGIYIVDPELLRFVPKNSVFNMTELLDCAIKEGLPVAAFPIHEYWVDIGKSEELKRAQDDADSGVLRTSE